MAITNEDLGVSDDDLRRRIMVTARRIAPCIDTFPDGSEDKANAVAILKGVIEELPKPGSRNIKSQSVNNASVTYRDVATAFEGDAEASLRSLCEAPAVLGLPMGSFPTDTVLDGLWPEGPYS